MSKKYTTNFLEDTNGSTGSANQVLVSTAAGIGWVDGSGSGIIGGPYLPLSAGSSYPLTGALYVQDHLILQQDGTNDLIKSTGNVLYHKANEYSFQDNSNSSWVTIKSGNVGIGTTAPSTPLHINADAPTLRLQDATSGDNHYLTGNNGEFRVQTSGYMTMRPGNTVSTTFLANGNVGIGTTSPDYPLHVDDTIKIGDRQGTDGSLILQSQQGPNITFKSTGDVLDISGTTGAANGNSIRLSDNIKKLYFNGGIGGTIAINRGNRGLMDSNLGGLEVQQQDTASSNGKSTFLSTSSLGTILRSTSYGSTGTSGDIQFQFGGGANTSEPSPTTKMVIKNSGNVGIGTTSPASTLHLKSNTSTLTLESSDTGLDPDQVWASLDFKQNDASQTPVGSVANISAIAKAGNTNFGNLLFQTKPRPADAYNDTLFLSSSGNVGIGTTSPAYKLEVDNSANAANNYITVISNNSNNSGVLFRDAGGNRGLIFANPDNDLVFMANGTSEKMRITSAGNVGIGTTAPSTSLHVKSTSAGSGYMTIENTVHYSKLDLKSTTYTGSIIMDGTGGYISGGGLILNSGTNVRTQFLQGGVAKMIINNGNVGIGTTSPSYPLVVARTGSNIVASFEGNENTYLRIARTGTQPGEAQLRVTNNGSLDISSDSNISLKTGGTSGTTRIYVRNSDGNVGIGTTSPGARLHVQGGASGYLFRVQGTSTLNVYDPGTAAEIGIGSSSGDKLKLFSNDSLNNGITIDTAGNVGIGTTSPTQKLEVDGEVLSDGYRVSAMQTAPAARNSTGTLGEIRITSNYIYVCYATNSWSRVALATSW